MTVISGGLVVYEDGVKAVEEYAPAKKARVELRFDVPEDATDGEQRLDSVIELTKRKVLEMLGKAKAAPATAPATPKVDTSSADNAKAAYAAKADADVLDETPAAEPEKPKAKRAPKAAKAAETPAVDQQPEKATTPAADDLSEFDVPAADISDADLNSAATKKNAALNEPVKIRNLISAFNPNPEKKFTLREIPQAQRRSFLDQLAAL